MLSPETEVAPVSTNFGIDSDFRLIFRNSGVADCHVFALADRNLRLAADDARTAELSSDGARLVYERGGDLFVYELDAQRERRRVACRPSSSGTTKRGIRSGCGSPIRTSGSRPLRRSSPASRALLNARCRRMALDLLCHKSLLRDTGWAGLVEGRRGTGTRGLSGGRNHEFGGLCPDEIEKSGGRVK